jgi:3-phenylpropionate/trans-cinnamate dioxygenase ferredoxin reductase subunit
MSGLVIVGASYGGLQLAAGARAAGYEGRITLIGDEAHAPYQRPPLSKGLLTGKSTVESLQLKSSSFYSDERIDLLLGQRATTLDAGARKLTLKNGDKLDYDWLALATGARPRRMQIQGDHLAGIFYLRTLDDALAIDAAAGAAKEVCVIGGGFIGLELASALAARGLAVTVLEAQPALLARVLPPVVSDHVAALHIRHGVKIRYGAAIERIVGDGGSVSAIELQDGTRIDCQMAVIGIGVVPNAELAESAGLQCDPLNGGIVVDGLGQTNAQRILAMGDVAAFSNPFAPNPDHPIRLESIQAAGDLARASASLLVDKPQPYSSVPWFWSDQYDMKLQMTGLAAPGDEQVIRGERESGRFTVYYLRDGRIKAAHSVSKPADHMLARKLITANATALAAQLSDASFDPRSLLSGV